MALDNSTNRYGINSKGQWTNYRTLWKAILQGTFVRLNAIYADTSGTPSKVRLELSECGAS